MDLSIRDRVEERQRRATTSRSERGAKNMPSSVSCGRGMVSPERATLCVVRGLLQRDKSKGARRRKMKGCVSNPRKLFPFRVLRLFAFTLSLKLQVRDSLRKSVQVPFVCTRTHIRVHIFPHNRFHKATTRIVMANCMWNQSDRDAHCATAPPHVASRTTYGDNVQQNHTLDAYTNR